VQFVGAALVQCQQGFAKGGVKRAESMAFDLHLTVFVDAGQHAIDAVQGCA